MGANAQTSVTLFVANAILTAQQQNFSAATGVPVFATTVTRDAAFGGSNKALAEGQLCYLESTDVVQYYTGAAWATVGPASASALTLISATTIGNAVGSVTVSSAFSTTYDNYQIFVNGGVASGNCDLKFTLGATATGYYSQGIYSGYTTTVAGDGAANTSSFNYGGGGSTDSLYANLMVRSPFLSQRTYMSGPLNISTTYAGFASGLLNNTTSYTAFTFTPNSGTLTGGTIYVYGYAKA
jgi:hypothetical protein